MIAWIVIPKMMFGPLLDTLTTEEINQTIWAFTGPLNMLSGISPLLFKVLAVGVGILLYAGADGSSMWKIGTGLLIILGLALTSQP